MERLRKAPLLTVLCSNPTTMSLDLDNLSNEDIARLCDSPEAQVISGKKGGRWVVRLSESIAVKAGWSITPEEAANQDYAHACSWNSGLKVPKVYRYFQLSSVDRYSQLSSVGYLVMEFIDGTSLEKISLQDRPHLIRRLAMSIRALATKELPEVIGPRNGGIPRGYLFSEEGAGTSFSSINSLNSWFNERSRLREGEDGFDFRLSDCAFCHLDLARRNLIMLPDETFCLLDWEYAGFYPRVFETYCLRFVGHIGTAQWDYEFSQTLESALDPEIGNQTEKERQIRMLDHVYRNNLRYCL